MKDINGLQLLLRLCRRSSLTSTCAAALAQGMTAPTYYPSTGETIQFKIQINSRTISASYGQNTLIAAVSTVAHEFGHVFGLADVDNASNPNYTLMNHCRDRTSITAPTAYDRSFIRSLYY